MIGRKALQKTLRDKFEAVIRIKKAPISKGNCKSPKDGGVKPPEWLRKVYHSLGKGDVETNSVLIPTENPGTFDIIDSEQASHDGAFHTYVEEHSLSFYSQGTPSHKYTTDYVLDFHNGDRVVSTKNTAPPSRQRSSCSKQKTGDTAKPRRHLKSNVHAIAPTQNEVKNPEKTEGEVQADSRNDSMDPSPVSLRPEPHHHIEDKQPADLNDTCIKATDPPIEQPASNLPSTFGISMRAAAERSVLVRETVTLVVQADSSTMQISNYISDLLLRYHGGASSQEALERLVVVLFIIGSASALTRIVRRLSRIRREKHQKKQESIYEYRITLFYLALR
jgi:hypothetical protein